MEKTFALTFQKLKESCGARTDSILSNLQSLPLYQVPMFLKEQGFSAEICELAYYESLRAFIEKEDQGIAKISPAGVALNSSLQWLEISASAAVLSKSPGIYALWKKEDELRELSLTPEQAEILDQLMDDLLPVFSESDIKELKFLHELGIVSTLDKDVFK